MPNNTRKFRNVNRREAVAAFYFGMKIETQIKMQLTCRNIMNYLSYYFLNFMKYHSSIHIVYFINF